MALTQEQFAELKRLNDEKDRTGFYIKYYEFTGVDQALEMAKISSFSGTLGGIAQAANALIERDYPALYHEGGVIQFSHDIQEAVFEAVKISYQNPNKGGFLSDLQMAEIAGQQWQKRKMGDKFPGNVEIVIEKLYGKHYCEARKDDNFIKELKQDVDKLFSEGTLYSVKGAYHHLTTDKYGKKVSDFADSSFYEKRFSPNFDTYYYIDKKTGAHVYVEESGISKHEEGGKTYYSIPVSNKQEAAKFLNLPADNIKVIDDLAVFTDVGVVSSGKLKFQIIKPTTIKEHEEEVINLSLEQEASDSGWFVFISNNVPSFERISEEMVNKAWGLWELHEDVIARGGKYTIKDGDTLWKLAQIHHTTVEAILLMPGNEKYLTRAKLGKDNKVSHVLIKKGETIILPKEGQKLYEGDARQRLIEILDEGEVEVRGIKTTKKADGTITEIEESATVKIDGKDVKASKVLEADARQEKEELKFISENFVKIDENANSIYKFTERIFDKLFSDENAHRTGQMIASRLVSGEKIESVARGVIKNAMAEAAVDSVKLPVFAKGYEEVFSNSVGKDIMIDFATRLLPNLGGSLSARDYRMMAYSSASKVVSQKAAESLLSSQSGVLQSTAAGAFAATAMSLIASGGKMNAEIASGIGVSTLSTYAATYASSAVTGALGLSSTLLSGLITGGIGAVIALGVSKLFVQKRKEISTYIESHSIRVNENSVLEFVTLRPAGTIIHHLGDIDKIIYARGASDAVITGEGSDTIILSGMDGGFVESGGNKPRQAVTLTDPVSNRSIETYIYFEKVIGSEGNDNKLDGQDGDDYINGRKGDDRIKGGSGHDLIEGGEGNDIIEGNDGDDTIDAGPGDDLVHGGRGRDEIYAGAGNDGTAEQPILGGPGDDVISCGVGVDIADGGEGDDVISGDEGVDVLYGGSGNDFLYGGAGADQMYGDEGNDNMEGGKDADNMFGGPGNDLIRGGDDDDSIFGGLGDDLLLGDSGNDLILGEEGNDKLYGGPGDDKYIYKAEELTIDRCIDGLKAYKGDGHDVIEDISGENDVLIIENIGIEPKDIDLNMQGDDLEMSFKGRYGSILIKDFAHSRSIEKIQLYGAFLNTNNIDLSNTSRHESLWHYENISKEVSAFDNIEIGQWYNNYFNEAQFASIPKSVKANLIQSVQIKHYRYEVFGIKWSKYYTTHPHYPHRLEGDNGNNKLIGNYWNEHILGHGGDDEIYGNNGDDHIQAGHGNDYAEGGNGNDVIEGGPGNDKLKGGQDHDRVYGNEGSDELYGEWGDDLLSGGPDDDHIEGGEGNDTMYGEDGNDTLLGGLGNDKAYGGNGIDKIAGGPGNDEIYGENGDDIIVGNDGNDALHGQDGADKMFGSDGNDKLYGGEGDDYLLGGKGDDEIHGGRGNDRIIGCLDIGKANTCLKFENVKQVLDLEDFCAKFPHGDAREHNRLYGNEGDDHIRGSIGPDLIDGGEGDDDMYGGPGDDDIYGGPGNDAAYGGEGNDILRSGPAYTILGLQPRNQILVGGPGDDTYHYNIGDGHVEIDDCGSAEDICHDGYDILKFGSGITVDNLIVEATHDDDVFIKLTSGSIKMHKQLGHKNRRIESMHFDDGLKVPIQKLLIGTAYDDHLIASDHTAVFGNDGDDVIEINNQQLAFGGKGQDTIKISGKNSSCYTTEGNDIYVIAPGTVNNIINIGRKHHPISLEIPSTVRVQDLLPTNHEGFNLGWRQGGTCVTIHNSHNNIAPLDKIVIPSINTVLQKPAQLKIVHTSEAVYKGGKASEWIIPKDTYTRAVYGGLGDDIMIGHPLRSNVLAGENGNDVLIGNFLSDTLEGGPGDDILYGDAGNDELIGGPGNDDLYAGPGKDYFVFPSDTKLDQGKDKIYNLNCREDAIELSGFGFDDRHYLPSLIYNITTDQAGNAVIEDKGNFHITTVGLDKSKITADCFTFGFMKVDKIRETDKMYSETLPNAVMRLWSQMIINQLSKNLLIDLKDIKLISLEELNFPFEIEQEETLKEYLKKFTYKKFQTKLLSSVPHEVKEAYLQLRSASLTAREDHSEASTKNLHEAQQHLSAACDNYAELYGSALELCSMYESQLAHFGSQNLLD